MLNTAAISGSFTWMPPAVPMSCIACSTCIETPVAPIGWPLALSPPEALTGRTPSFATLPSAIARAPPGERRSVIGDDVALAHGQEIVHLLGRPEDDRLLRLERGLDIGQDQ